MRFQQTVYQIIAAICALTTRAKRVLLVAAPLCAFLALAPGVASAQFEGTVRSVACSGTITSALQAAIDESADSDVVSIGAGTCSAGQVEWSNKNIKVQGQGVGTTTVSGLSFRVTVDSKASFRITGLSVACPTPWRIDALDRKTGIKGWRIDNIAWSCESCGQHIAVQVNGITWGLIDSSSFDNMGNAIFLTGFADKTDEVNPWPPDGTPGMGGYNWLLPLNLGSDEAVYVENNVFTLANKCYYGVGDMYHGAKMVFRHNTVTNAYWQNHAARGYERGGSRGAEIYNNDFNALDSAWHRAIHIRSGTGVVFNNRLRGYFTTMQVDNQRSNGQSATAPYGACDGSTEYDGNAAGGSGWPCLDQIGRGSGSPFPKQPSVPLYVWNNGTDVGCNIGGACSNNRTMINDGDGHVQAGRDFINNGTTPKPGYTPLPYPHPLRGETTLSPPPAAPSGLRVVSPSGQG